MGPNAEDAQEHHRPSRHPRDPSGDEAHESCSDKLEEAHRVPTSLTQTREALVRES